MGISNVSENLTPVELTVAGKTFTFNPNDDNIIEIPLSNQSSMVLTVEHTGCDGQVEDLMYLLKYKNPDGTFQPGKHVYGHPDQLIRGLRLILENFNKNSIFVIM